MPDFLVPMFKFYSWRCAWCRSQGIVAVKNGDSPIVAIRVDHERYTCAFDQDRIRLRRIRQPEPNPAEVCKAS